MLETPGPKSFFISVQSIVPMSATTTRTIGLALAGFVIAFTSSAGLAQTVQINPDVSIGPTILRAGWDIKAWPARLNTVGEARGLYEDVDANFLRIPFFPNAHNSDGSVVTSQYDTELDAIRSVLAVNPDVEIYASVKLMGADTFPAWVSQPTAAWPAETGRIFGNTVDRPNPEHYSTMVTNYLSYLKDEGISIDFLGLNNETEDAVPVDRYIATYDLLEAKLDLIGFDGEFRDFEYVGPDSFGLPIAERFIEDLGDAGRLDTIDFVASHYYPQHGSGNESDWQDLSALSGGKPLFHTELHMPGNSAAIAELSQTVRDALSVQFASMRNGVDSYIWWDSGNNTNRVRDVIKRQVMTTTLGAAPVFTKPNYQGKGDSDGEPLFQAFVEDGLVTLWIVNPGSDINNLPVNMLSQQVGSSLSGKYYLAPDGDNVLLASDIVPLSFNLNANGLGFTIDQIPSQSIAVVVFDIDPLTDNTNTEVVFSNDFEDGDLTAEIGSMTLVADSVTPSIVAVTGGSDATLGNNVVLLDRNTTTLNLTLNLTDTLSLADGNTVRLDFDVAARRTNGNSKTIFVDAMDSNGNIAARFVLGDHSAFGNGDSDRQRPGYATGGEGNLTFGNPPGNYWWGSDNNPAEFNASRDAHMSLTLRDLCFDFSTTKQDGSTFNATGVSNFGGGSIADIAEIKITSFGVSYGMYFDNLKVEGVVVNDSGGGLTGDFDNDDDVDIDDINFYSGNIGSAAEGTLAQLDLNSDGQITLADLDTHLTTYVQTSNGQTGTFRGDVNLDGMVNVLGDAFALIGNLNSVTSNYADGDLNFDGTVSVLGDAFVLIGNLSSSNAP